MGRVDASARPKATGSVSLFNHRYQPQKWWHLGGQDISHVPIDVDPPTGPLEPSEVSSEDLDNGNVFEAPEAANIYKPVEGFEGSHRFDPEARWSTEEEQRLVRKLDWRIAMPACIMFFCLQLDRGNLALALSDNMLDDLNMNTNEFNNSFTIFYVSVLISELPSQLMSKKFGPDNWIPVQMVSWSIVAAAQAGVQGRAGFYACRFLLGIMEGGFAPDLVLYLSYFFTNTELPARASWFVTTVQGSQILSAFMAYGILHLRGKGSLGGGWRYLYLIEGVLTGAIGVVMWLYLPASPTQTARRGWRGLLRPKKGWFTAREETIMVTRILRDDPGKSTMHNRQGVNWNMVKKALLDYDLWPVYLIAVTGEIPFDPPEAYLTLTCRALGFDKYQTTFLTIPSYALIGFFLLFWTWLATKLNQRILIGIFTQFWGLPFLIALTVLPPQFPNSNWTRWIIATLIIGHPLMHPIWLSVSSRNAGSVETRTVSASLYNMAFQLGGVIASQIYRDDDRPYYYRGNKVLLGITAWNIVFYVVIKVYYVQRNKKRDKIWLTMTRDERVHYLATTKDEGNKRLNFRFAR